MARAKAWLIASGKGGVGKSMATAGLAVALSRQGKKVVVVDADIGLRDQDAILGLENRIVYDILDVINKGCTLDQALVKHSLYERLSLLPASQFARVKNMDPKGFRKVISQLKSRCDFILIDCPAGVERGLRGVVDAADEVILVSTPDDVCIRDVEKTAGVLAQKEAPRPRLIVNRLIPELIEAGEMYSAQVVAETLDLGLLGEIPQDEMIYRALLKHMSPMEVECEGRRAMERIALRMMGQEVLLPSYGKAEKGLLSRLFHRKVKVMKLQ